MDIGETSACMISVDIGDIRACRAVSGYRGYICAFRAIGGYRGYKCMYDYR